MISALKEENSRLIALRDSLSGAVTNSINNASTFLDECYASLKNGFTVKNETVDNNSIKNNKAELDAIISTISGKIIPSINAQIDANNSRIAAELARIAEEEAAELEKLAANRKEAR